MGPPKSLEFNLVTLNCSLQKILAQNTDHANEKNIPIKDKDDLVKQYPGCFDGIGKFQGQYHITVDPSVPLVVHAHRRVPLSLREDIKHELDHMESKGIIVKLKEGKPTAWVNSLVYRRKPNGQLRICLDPKDLNKAIRRGPRHRYLRRNFTMLAGAKFFSIISWMPNVVIGTLISI